MMVVVSLSAFIGPVFRKKRSTPLYARKPEPYSLGAVEQVTRVATGTSDAERCDDGDEPPQRCPCRPASGAPVSISGIGAVTGYGWGEKLLREGLYSGEYAVRRHPGFSPAYENDWVGWPWWRTPLPVRTAPAV